MILPLLLLFFAPPGEAPHFFRPYVRPAVPQSVGGSNPVDAFILARLAKEGLTLNEPASRSALLRRASFDLTGLPPSREQQECFHADARPGAYERAIDRMLASPAFGERWAQHWLDLVRYAESDGFNQDALRPEAYRYRDWVIQALNADMPYDRFMHLQLAGDQSGQFVATGFLRLWPDEHNAAQLEQRWQEILDDTTDTVGAVFLGLTVGCARCHDHKYDPVSQKDYYRLQSFFAGMIPRDIPLGDGAALKAWEKVTAPLRDEMEKLAGPLRRQEYDRALERLPASVQAIVRTKNRSPYQEQIARMALGQMDRAAAGAHARLKGAAKKRYAALAKKLSPRPVTPSVLAVVEVAPQTPPTHRLVGGDWRKPAALVKPGFPASLGGKPDLRSGRRAALAAWLADPKNPLPARVAVNRIWQHLTGRGIVATPSDFGVMGATATHPALLDWLASELVANGWRLKPLVRLIVTSDTYRQSSFFDPGKPAHVHAAKVDKSNDLLWRMRRRRLEGEAIRDAILTVSGSAQRTMFGPSARPVLPPGAGRMAWKPDPDPSRRDRRSVYVLARRNLRFPLFDAFDQPDLCQPCAARLCTTTAPQALAMLNGDLTRAQARLWAASLEAESPSLALELAFHAAFSRRADAQEMRLALDFLSRQRRRGLSPLDSLSSFCHALFNTSEFCHVD